MDSQLFNKSLQFAAENGSTFNGVLCGRATWQTEVLAKDGEVAREWLQTEGIKNLKALNQVNQQTATPI